VEWNPRRVLQFLEVMTNTTVLIVGGSLNGLTMALLLAHQGVPCMLIERHRGTTVQYKLSGISGAMRCLPHSHVDT
jgi:2-polyprenyl-6-methoxyphenol hydroxylase-like FAD-dependent oxidoreductase